MSYTGREILDFIQEEEVRFIRLEFCDIYGKAKCITIMPTELERAIQHGISIDGSAISGFGGDNIHSDLFLHPDLDTFTLLPWRPENGKAVRMFCFLTYPDGRPFENDSRRILQDAVTEASHKGYEFAFGSEFEFYLFNNDENGHSTREPIDYAGYMDVAPEDRGENVRREVCLMLEELNMKPESAHHEEGPGQNEIDFSYADPLKTADNGQTFCLTVKTIAGRNGLSVDFSPKPLKERAGNGLHINMSAKGGKGDNLNNMIAGVLRRIKEITLFLNPTEDSYERLGSFKAPKYISWSSENRSQLIRIPAAKGEYVRAELRSPDANCNLYLAFALLIHAALEGLEEDVHLPKSADINFFTAPKEVVAQFDTLPLSLSDAKECALKSSFVAKVLPESVVKAFVERV